MNAHTTLQPARRSILRWLGVLSMTLVVGTAAAQGTGGADVELALVHGTKASASASPSGWPELNKPPFDAYNHYELLSTKKLSLQKGVATKESLPDGSSLEATLVETTPKVKIDLVVKDSKGALISKASYASPKGKRFIPVSTPYKGGSLVVGLKVL